MTDIDSSSENDTDYQDDAALEETVYAEYEPQFSQFWIPVVSVIVLIALIAGLIILFFWVTF